MKKPRNIIILLLVLGILGLGLYLYLRPKTAVKIVFPELEKLQKVKIKLETDTARISFNAVINNGGLFKINIDSLYYYLKLDTAKLLDHKEFLNIELPPGHADTVLLTVGLPYTKLKKQIRTLQKQDSTKIHLKLDILYDTWMGKAKLPVERDFSIEVPHPPRFTLIKTEYIGRDKKTLLVNAHIQIDNPGKLDLNITDLVYKMDVKDLFTLEQVFPEKVTIKPGTSQTLILPVHVEIKKLLKTAFLVITNNDRVPYKLHMRAQVKSGMVDADKTPFELEKEGELELKK